MQRKPERNAKMVKMFDEGKSCREIARKFNVTRGAVSVVLRKAKQKEEDWKMRGPISQLSPAATCAIRHGLGKEHTYLPSMDDLQKLLRRLAQENNGNWRAGLLKGLYGCGAIVAAEITQFALKNGLAEEPRTPF